MIFHQPGYTNMSVEYQSEYFVCKLIMSVYGLLFKVSFHSASLGRFVPHHASAEWRKAPLHKTIFRLNLEKEMAALISMLTSSMIGGCDFYNPLQLFGMS